MIKTFALASIVFQDDLAEKNKLPFKHLSVEDIDFLKELFIPNNAYWGAIKIVPVVLLAYLFLGIYHNLSIWYKLTDKTRYGMYFSIIGAVITIVLNVWLLNSIGIMAAAWATLIAYGSMAFISYIIGKKHYPVNYNLKKMAIYLIASIAICAVSFLWFRGNFYLSTGFVILFGGIIFLNEKKELLQLINRR